MRSSSSSNNNRQHTTSVSAGCYMRSTLAGLPNELSFRPGLLLTEIAKIPRGSAHAYCGAMERWSDGAYQKQSPREARGHAIGHNKGYLKERFKPVERRSCGPAHHPRNSSSNESYDSLYGRFFGKNNITI